MKTQLHVVPCDASCLRAAGIDPDRSIYFDIETTGFRPSTSHLYMIGWAVKNGEDWAVTQIMAEHSGEELLLLDKFGSLLPRFDTIIEFNGNRFDLPYMKEKYASYDLPDPFEGCTTVDLYQEIKPYKDLLGMSRLNQKSVEQFLHITREDPYNGGELIDVYRSYRSHTCADESSALKALFLHNYEDVLGMIDMTPLLSYRLSMTSSAEVSLTLPDINSITPFYLKEHCPVQNVAPSSGHFPESGDMPRQDPEDLSARASVRQPALMASFLLDVPVPVDLFYERNFCRICVCGNCVNVEIPLVSDTLLHFFPDFRNYYYLPLEDTVIHKSVAVFADPSHREKAKAQNCFVKKTGLFLPQPHTIFEPVFQRKYKDKTLWFEYDPSLFDDKDKSSEYIHALITSGL